MASVMEQSIKWTQELLWKTAMRLDREIKKTSFCVPSESATKNNHWPPCRPTSLFGIKAVLTDNTTISCSRWSDWYLSNSYFSISCIPSFELEAIRFNSGLAFRGTFDANGSIRQMLLRMTSELEYQYAIKATAKTTKASWIIDIFKFSPSLFSSPEAVRSGRAKVFSFAQRSYFFRIFHSLCSVFSNPICIRHLYV